jgi:hypothetical protein
VLDSVVGCDLGNISAKAERSTSSKSPNNSVKLTFAQNATILILTKCGAVFRDLSRNSYFLLYFAQVLLRITDKTCHCRKFVRFTATSQTK